MANERPPSLKPKQRLQLSLTMDMVDTEATEATEAMVDTALEDTGATMANERPRLSLTMDTVDTVDTVVDTEAMADTVLDTAGATMASVRRRLSLTTDTVDTEVRKDRGCEGQASKDRCEGLLRRCTEEDHLSSWLESMRQMSVGRRCPAGQAQLLCSESRMPELGQVFQLLSHDEQLYMQGNLSQKLAL